MTNLSAIKFVLASASPRRKELLHQIGIDPVVMAGNYLELNIGDNPLDIVAHNAKGKLLDIVENNDLCNSLIMAADTIVVLDGEYFGKPRDSREAFTMLERMSNKKHNVITGVAIYYNGEIRYDYSVTDVYMRTIKSEEIKAYVASDEPYDKAGGYGIQAKGAVFVEKIDGCYSNVVGLPLPLLCKMLQELNFTVL